jgi:hypothetical protein
MTFRTLAGAAAVVLACSTFAFAATTSKPMKPHMVATAASCSAIEAQFNAAYPNHLKAHYAAMAKIRADRGTKLCAANHFSSGQAQLIKALKDIGVKAKV